MSEDTGSAPEVLFKSNKRRKIYRRRNAEDEQDEDPEAESPEAVAAAGEDEGGEEGGGPSIVKRPTAKKRGINFSSAARPTTDTPTETSIVPYEEQQPEDMAQTDRFIKPSGSVRVVEDKHLTAYVDSKMAELRASTPASLQTQADQLQAGTADEAEPQLLDSSEGPKSTTNVQHAEGIREGPRKGYAYGSRPLHQRRRPRRQPPPKDETAVARESMVDQILAESQVPMYDRSAPTAIKADAAASDATAYDADEAAAEAFKAEFLVSLEQRRRRRPPAAPAGAKGAQVSSGPKLGGSRSQREKMKALEEAAKTAGKK